MSLGLYLFIGGIVLIGWALTMEPEKASVEELIIVGVICLIVLPMWPIAVLGFGIGKVLKSKDA